MSCPECGLPFGEAVVMGGGEHTCPDGVKLELEPTPEPEPEPVDDEG